MRNGRTSYVEYLRSAHFLEARFENWESEFLQMARHVWLTVFLPSAGHQPPIRQEVSGAKASS